MPLELLLVYAGLFKAVAARFVSDDGGPPLRSTWLRRLLDRHPELSTTFSSGLKCQRALSSNPELSKDYFRKLQPLHPRQGICQSQWGFGRSSRDRGGFGRKVQGCGMTRTDQLNREATTRLQGM